MNVPYLLYRYSNILCSNALKRCLIALGTGTEKVNSDRYYQPNVPVSLTNLGPRHSSQVCSERQPTTIYDTKPQLCCLLVDGGT
ncbi:unnamed protein product [Ceutorhynchus assimilis]|uniref:Uncharacterized protein n=1 Tax=Ceutorhynchus assimilis TaxID=467358 RepID=A0A9N9MHV2_9CUCU|nr:unnamed protein product [Ceutorhynchus assimilis]